MNRAIASGADVQQQVAILSKNLRQLPLLHDVSNPFEPSFLGREKILLTQSTRLVAVVAWIPSYGRVADAGGLTNRSLPGPCFPCPHALPSGGDQR